MIYYIKKRILKINDKEFKLSKSENKILLCFKESDIASYKDLMINVYGIDNKKLCLGPLYALKERLCRRTGLQIKPYMGTGYKLFIKIKFIEED